MKKLLAIVFSLCLALTSVFAATEAAI